MSITIKEAEKRIISLLLQKEMNIREATNKGVTGEYFSEDINKYFFELICEYHHQHRSLLTKEVLKDSFESNNRSAEEIAYVINYYEDLKSVPADDNDFSYYLAKIVDVRSEREIVKLVKNAVSTLKDKDDPQRIAKATESVLNGAIKISQSREGGNVVTTRDFVEDFSLIEQNIVNRNQHPEMYRGHMCHIEEIDSITGGFRPGELALFCAETGGGKTTLMMNVAHGIYRPRRTPSMSADEWDSIKFHGKNILYVNLEVGEEMFGLKMTSMDARVSFSALKEGVMSQNRIDSIIKSRDYRKNLKSRFKAMHVVQNSLMSVGELDSYIKEVYSYFRPDVVCVDYIDLMNPITPDKDRRRALGNICVELRAMGKKYGFAVITVAQLKRDAIERIVKGKEKDIRLSDVGESSLIANHCDFAFGILQDAECDDKVWIYSLKNRFGSKPKKFHLVWIKGENWIGSPGSWLYGKESENTTSSDRDEFMALKEEMSRKDESDLIEEEIEIKNKEREEFKSSVDVTEVLSESSRYDYLDIDEDGFISDDDMDATFGFNDITENEQDQYDKEEIPSEKESEKSKEPESKSSLDSGQKQMVDDILNDMEGGSDNSGSKFVDAGRRADW